MDNSQPWAPEAKMREAILEGSLIRAYDEAIKFVKSANVKADLSLVVTNLQYMTSECKLMTDSMVDGCVVPDLDTLFSRMRENLHDMADNLSLVIAAATPDVPVRIRTLANSCSPVSDITALIADYKQMALVGSDGFEVIEPLCRVLDAQKIAEHEAKAIFNSLINDHELPELHRAYAVSALCHNIMSRHDRHLALSLISALRMGGLEPAVKGRCAVALIADMISWPRRWMTDRVLLDELDDLVEDSGSDAALLLRSVFVLFAKARMVDIVFQLLNADVVREVNNIVGNLIKAIIDRKKVSGDAGVSITLSEDEAQEIFGFRQKAILDKFARLEQWKQMGIDVGYHSMKNMKDFPFFRNSFLHWLRPFDPSDAEVTDSVAHFDDKDDVLKSVAALSALPDSDKYSLTFSFKTASQELSQKLCEAIKNAELSADALSCAGETCPPAMSSELVAADGFVKDLYRAWKLRPDEFGYTPVFSSLTDVIEGGPVYHIFPSDSLQDKLGSLLVKFECWPEALKVFSSLCERSGADSASDAAIIRKYAYCLIKAGRDEDAIEQLRRAEIIDDSDIWTKRVLAECYAGLGRYAAAAYVVERANELGKADSKMLFIAASCNISLRRYDAAMQYYKSIAEAEPSNVEAACGVARCLLLLGRDDEAKEKISGLAEVGSSATLAISAIYSAVTLCFSQAKDMLVAVAKEKGCAAAIAIINDNKDILLSHGISEGHVFVLADRVRAECDQLGIE